MKNILIEKDTKKMNATMDELGIAGVPVDLQQMIDDGLIEVVGVKGFEPVYGITEKGKREYFKIKKAKK
jgi:hypothetical protein